MENHDEKAGLLTLPRELRDLIYAYATESHWRPATALLVTPDQYKGLTYYEAEHAKWQHLGLLGVNRQLRAEIQDFAAQKRKLSDLTAELDLIVKGYVYTPTWTHLDYTLHPRDKLDRLQVNLHIHSTEAFRRDESWPQPPGHIFHELISLLSRFIFLGPSCLDPSPPCQTPGPHFIKLLSVRVFYHDYYTYDTWPSTTHEIFRNLKTLSMLNTAYRYLGAVRASVSYNRKGEWINRTAEWEVRPGGQSRYPGGSRFREVDWAVMGFRFGESWFNWYKKWQSLHDEEAAAIGSLT